MIAVVREFVTIAGLFVVRDRSDNIKSALTVCVSANFKPFRFGLRFLMAEE